VVSGGLPEGGGGAERENKQKFWVKSGEGLAFEKDGKTGGKGPKGGTMCRGSWKLSVGGSLRGGAKTHELELVGGPWGRVWQSNRDF